MGQPVVTDKFCHFNHYPHHRCNGAEKMTVLYTIFDKATLPNLFFLTFKEALNVNNYNIISVNGNIMAEANHKVHPSLWLYVPV
jgi:hypothetical protein